MLFCGAVLQNTVGDSELIIAYLKAVYPDLTSRVPSMETGPPLATAAAARCCAEAEVQLHPRSCGPVPPLLISADPAIRRKVAEDSLYFHLLFFRWLTPAGWRGMQPLFASAGVWAPMVGGVMRSAVQKNLHGQGTSRHSPADIMRLAKADIDILAGLLGGQPFYGGAAPSQDDCAVFSCLDQLLYGMRAGAEDAAAYVERQPTLCAYTDRMRRLLFPHVVEGRQLADGTQFPMALAQQPLASL